MSTETLHAGWNSLLFDAANGVALQYQLYIPENFHTDTKYPAILYMHSAGVRCDDNSHIYTGEAKFLRNLETGAYKNDCLVLAPCCPNTDSWVALSTWTQPVFDADVQPQSAHMAAAMELFWQFTKEFPVDLSRLYLYGMSMGGFAVWDIASRYPHTFAAAITAAGRGMPQHAERLRDLAIWIFHGTADTVIPYTCGVELHDALTATGRTDVRFTTFEGAGHGIWERTADTEGLYDWMFSKRRENA